MTSVNAASKLRDGWTYVKIRHQPLNANGTKRGDPEAECLQCGLPFNAARSSQYRDMVDQLTRMHPGYKPPEYNRLREQLLGEEKDRVAAELKSCIDSSTKAGSDLTSDGWSDARSRPLLNFFLITPKGAQFIKAVDTSGQSKTDDYIADRLFEAGVLTYVWPLYCHCFANTVKYYVSRIKYHVGCSPEYM